MITMGSPYFVWINTNEIISSRYLLGAVCVAPLVQVAERLAEMEARAEEWMKANATGTRQHDASHTRVWA
jgi:hypothetical protein